MEFPRVAPVETLRHQTLASDYESSHGKLIGSCHLEFPQKNAQTDVQVVVIHGNVQTNSLEVMTITSTPY